MSSWMNNLRNFGRGNSQPRTNQQQAPPPSRGGTSSPSANSQSSPASQNTAQAPPSPSQTTSATMQTNEQAHNANQRPKNPPLFFREEHWGGFVVKGNFMTLAAKPHLIEEGEWLAHQVVEQNRILTAMTKIVQEPDKSTGRPTCNEQSCPTMSAGPSHTWTWIDTARNPINLPAPIYIKHIQTWVSGKVQDESVFPTTTFQTAPPLPNPQQVANDPNHWVGKSSGFPQRLEPEVKNMYKQMVRCYAHLYWNHWLDFHNLSAVRELNTCFIHFVNVGRSFGLLTDKDTEPMQPLIDLWIRLGFLPKAKENEAVPAAAVSSAVPMGVAGPSSAGQDSAPTVPTS